MATEVSLTPDTGSILAFNAATGGQVAEWTITPEQSVMYTRYSNGSAVTVMADTDGTAPEDPYDRETFQHLDFTLVLPSGYKLDVRTEAPDTLIGMQVVG